jgi:hypothetical protein
MDLVYNSDHPYRQAEFMPRESLAVACLTGTRPAVSIASNMRDGA